MSAREVGPGRFRDRPSSSPRRWLALAGTALLLGGCAETEAPGPGTITEVVIGVNDRPQTLDPAASADAYAARIVVNVYDTLFRFRLLARPVELTPNLAAEPPQISAGGRRYRIRLKEGVRFTDDPVFPGGRGREVTAEDVEYSIKRHFFPGVLSTGRWMWEPHLQGLASWVAAGADADTDFPGVRAVDRYTVEFMLREPYPQFLYSLAHASSAIVAREAVAHYGAEIASHPVGSGPFVLRSADPARIVLERNPDFRAERVDLAAEGFDPERHGGYGLEAIEGRRLPVADRIVGETLADSEVLWQSYLKGDEVHLVSVPGSVREQMSEDGLGPELEAALRGHHLSISPALSIVYMVFNMADPQLGDTGSEEARAAKRALRCAVRAAYDWEARIEATFGGMGAAFDGVLHPALPEYADASAQRTVRRDPGAARALLASQGWSESNLPAIVFAAPGSTAMRQVFEQWRAMLLDIGYPAQRLRMRGYPSFGAFSQAMARGEVQYMHTSWAMDYPDAENLLQLFYGPNASPGPNTANYANPEFDRLFEAWRYREPGPGRTRAFRRLNQMIIDDCVLVGSAAPMGVKAWQPGIVAFADSSMVGGFAWRFFGRRDE